MDPIVESLQRIKPTDHSLDGLPVTVVVVAFGLLLVTTLALRMTGRSWRTWYLPALCMLFAWWTGINVGRSGFRGAGMLCTLLLVILLIEPARTVISAALVPAKREG